MILNCIKSAKLSVIWNGDRLDGFIPARGLRQGDPLSPYLFVLCMEVLSHKIKTAITSKLWKPCTLSRGGPTLSHLFFADDLLLFGTASSHQAAMMKEIMEAFCRDSGQKMNLSKSKIWVSPNLPLSVGRLFLQKFGVPVTRDLGNYLGVPLLSGAPTSKHFHYLVERTEKRLSGWTGKLLSRASRLVLLKSITTTLPHYVMQVCKLPQKTIDNLERVNRNFFWGSTEHRWGIHPIVWSQVCRLKSTGGLGIRPLLAVNKVLLAKLTWRFLTFTTTSWSQILWGKYGDMGTLQSGALRRGCSSVWRGMELGFHLLRQGLDDTSDHLTWTPSSRGFFTVKSAYGLLSAEACPVSTPLWSKLWRLRGPSRGPLLLWLIALNRLKTKTLLWHRHCIDSPLCDICFRDDESTMHAVQDCAPVAALWQQLVPRDYWNQFWASDNPSCWVALNLPQFRCDSSGLPVVPNWRYIFSQALQSIWHSRNLLLFQRHLRNPPIVQANRILLSTLVLLRSLNPD